MVKSRENAMKFICAWLIRIFKIEDDAGEYYEDVPSVKTPKIFKTFFIILF